MANLTAVRQLSAEVAMQEHKIIALTDRQRQLTDELSQAHARLRELKRKKKEASR